MDCVDGGWTRKRTSTIICIRNYSYYKILNKLSRNPKATASILRENCIFLAWFIRNLYTRTMNIYVQGDVHAPRVSMETCMYVYIYVCVCESHLDMRDRYSFLMHLMTSLRNTC